MSDKWWAGFTPKSIQNTLNRKIQIRDDRIERLEADLRKMALDYLAADGQAAEAYQEQLAAEYRIEELEAMKTNLTQKQLDQLAELITLGEYKDGTLFIKDVRGNVYGSVKGNVRNVKGNVLGDVEGDVTGNVGNNVYGSVCGDVKGNVEGNVKGGVVGIVWGQIAGKYWTSLESGKYWTNLEYREVSCD